MDAIKFCKEFRRMCSANTGSCLACPLLDWRYSNSCSCTDMTKVSEELMKERIEIVEKWSKEHPVKTLAQDFFEKFPNAPTYSGCKTPVICPNHCGYKVEPGCEGDHDCITCWNRPLED